MRSHDDDRDRPPALAREGRQQRAPLGRGSLRIYLGAFAGVGKTYAMLNEAQRRRKYGEDVVVGLVETHGRSQTEAMLAGLEVTARKRIEYRGVAVEEMDTEAILRRRPAVCLVDELAHTNAPGSEREKRYEDVDVLRDAGIDIVATLNVQHLESLNDTIESITGVRVRETVPDSVVDDADELILIDLSPEAARARMLHGNIYPAAQAQAALDGFFRSGNLAALREIALRRTAQEVDAQLDTYMRELRERRADVEDRLLAYIDDTPFARTLIRRGWRLAQGLHAELLVAYVDRERGDAASRELARSLELAEDMTARVMPVQGDGGATDALLALVRAETVTHVVLAYQRAGMFERLTGHTQVDRLMTGLRGLEVHLVNADG
jgi:two-component system sensor histidine kinase KdpD